MPIVVTRLLAIRSWHGLTVGITVTLTRTSIFLTSSSSEVKHHRSAPMVPETGNSPPFVDAEHCSESNCGNRARSRVSFYFDSGHGGPFNLATSMRALTVCLEKPKRVVRTSATSCSDILETGVFGLVNAKLGPTSANAPMSISTTVISGSTISLVPCIF